MSVTETDDESAGETASSPVVVRNHAVRLGPKDWDSELGGWRCTLIGGARPNGVRLFFQSEELLPSRFQVDPDLAVIRWTGPDRPNQVTAAITLRPGIAPKKTADYWRRLAIVLPFVGTIVGSVLTYLGTRHPSAEIADAPKRVTLAVFPKTTEALPEVVRLIKSAASGSTLTLAGLNFHITAKESDDELIESVRNGANVRVLVLDPADHLCAEYVRRFVHTSDFRDECLRSLAALASIRSNLMRGGTGSKAGKFDVRFHPHLPTYRCYYLDRGESGRELIFLPYLEGLKSSDTPLAFISSPSPFSDQVKASLDVLWDRAEPWDNWSKRNPDLAKTLTEPQSTHSSR